jgi:putative ATP-dependent endonuclease of OLD family
MPMQLTKLTIKGFRCLNNFDIDFANLTVLIGENDAGKSSILDFLEIFFGDKTPDQDDYYCSLEGERVKTIEITCVFSLGENDDQAKPFSINNILSVRKIYTPGDVGTETLYLGEKYQNAELNINFHELDAGVQKALIQKLNPSVADTDISNVDKRSTWFQSYSEQSPKEQAWIQPPARWGSFLPRFERFSAMDYKTPSSLVSKTLKQVFEQTIFETVGEDGERRLIKELQDVQEKAKKELSVKINELENHIKRYNKRIQDFGYEPEFDFLNSLKSGDFLIDTGRGFHPLTKIGDGSKRRMFMAVMDWDREVTLAQAKEDANLQTIIRGYDEPDTNLHYGAQRLMYQTIEEIVTVKNSRVQAILCTHSLAMIDRAPSQNIRMLLLDEQGCTTVEKLITQDDPDVEYFLLGLARELGITNSVMFYERCFILIEGETEENALPILYKKIYSRNLVEDGIRIINVRSNGAVKEFLKLLSNNRQKYTLVLVDKDTDSNPSAKLHSKILRDAQFAQDFIDHQVIYIGTQEFEDVFSNAVIVECLNQHWPKADGTWEEAEIQSLRGEKKFSDALRRKVYESAHPEIGSHWSKPEFGKTLAEMCSVENIPLDLKSFFDKARQIADS